MPAFQRGAGQSAAHLRVRLNHGASDITQSRRPSPIRCVPSRSLAAVVRPRRVRDRSRAPLFLPLAPSSLFLFTPLSHSFSLSRPRARSTSSLSLSVSPHLFLSLFLTLFPSCRIASLSDAGPLLFLSTMRSDRVFRGAKCVRGDLCPSVVPSLSPSLRLLLPQTLAIIARSILSSGFSPCRSLSTLSFGF